MNSQTVIQALRKLNPQERKKFINKRYKKNKKFFDKKHPSIGKLLKTAGTGNFAVRINDRFLNIIDKNTNELCHPEAGLDKFAEIYGNWTHDAWVDLIDSAPRSYTVQGKYTGLLVQFQLDLINGFPEYLQRNTSGHIFLPKTLNGYRFSNSVVFIGLFHGLHIDHYLNHTEIHNAAFIEPDPHRFVVSCFFLDYKALENRFGGLILNVGNAFPFRHLGIFYEKAMATGPVWTRILPGYASPQIEPLMRKLRLHWRSFSDIWNSLENETQALIQGMDNLRSGKRILASRPSLSSNARIAVIGAGPSLSNDISWLHENRDKLIIFATHTSVKPLKANGIEPDFQFNIESRAEEKALIGKLCLDRYIPYVCYYKVAQKAFDLFSEVLLVPERRKNDPVRIFLKVEHTHPTTGNVAMALACFYRPAAIYLLGLDFGFKDIAQSHVKGSFMDGMDHKKSGIVGHEQIMVTPNFKQTGPVYTRAYFNIARMEAENAIARLPAGTVVFNLADGAKIQGALPAHSGSVLLSNYPEKISDLETIKQSFCPAKKGVHWEPYENKGKELIDAFKNLVLHNLELDSFTFPDFSKALDICYTEIVRNLVRKNDIRVEPYFAFLQDLFKNWYRCMVHAHNVEEGRRVYETGLESLRKIMKDIDWPEELSDI